MTVLLAILLPFSNVLAKGFSSSRSSSSSSRSSFSSSSKPSTGFSSSSKPNVVKPSTPSTGFSSSNSSKTNQGASLPSSISNKPKTSFDYAQQRKSLTPPKPKEQYVADFKKNNQDKYPTTFNSQPTSRPNYIPPSTTYNGVNRPIEYNPATRSYGFFDDLGKFMIYDAITDIALDSFKKDETVYVQTVENLKQQEQIVKQQEESSSFWGWVFLVIVVLLLVGFIFCTLD